MTEAPSLYSYRDDLSVPPFPDDKPLFVFDGECVLCSGGAAWLMRHDKNGTFRFTSAQSPLGRALYLHYGMAIDETYLLIDAGRPFGKSSGYLQMARRLGAAWNIFRIFAVLPPAFMDYFYGIVARNRYRWFGRTQHCALIPGDWAKKLL